MRAFVAINLPDHERVRLHASLAPLRALRLPVRWLPPESLHVTLKFLGEIHEAQAARVEAVLADVAARATPFDIEAGGVGAFPNLRRPRVWWIGVRENAALMRAQAALETALASAGHPREDRSFSPHITIGRTKAVPRRLDASANDVAHEIQHHARFHVPSLDLMESHLSPDGARYTRRLAAPLATAARQGESGTQSVSPEEGRLEKNRYVARGARTGHAAHERSRFE